MFRVVRFRFWHNDFFSTQATPKEHKGTHTHQRSSDRPFSSIDVHQFLDSVSRSHSSLGSRTSGVQPFESRHQSIKRNSPHLDDLQSIVHRGGTAMQNTLTYGPLLFPAPLRCISLSDPACLLLRSAFAYAPSEPHVCRSVRSAPGCLHSPPEGVEQLGQISEGQQKDSG